jgi:hypothetical protein
MAPPNKPLEKRAGRNIGLSPIGGPQSAYQQYVGAPVLKLNDNDTVLWEGVAGSVRALRGTLPKFCGLLLSNDDTLHICLNLIFVDKQGNEFEIGFGELPAGDGVGFLALFLDFGPVSEGLWPFVLCEGEKVIARIFVGDDCVPPNGKVVVVPYSKDYKIKGGGKGGLSDGGVLCLRGQVPPSGGLVLGPPPGITWEELNTIGGIAGGGGAFGGSHVSNSSVGGPPAELVASLIAPDGTEYEAVEFIAPPGEITSIEASISFTFFPLPSLFAAGYLQHPAKIKYKFKTGSPLPTGRVDILGLVGENDVAPDLTQEA